jgi:hypothetical protein
MAELLMRGAQTVGELRGRAARMEPIKDLGELQPILAALKDKGLITYLTPPGRGCIVTHTLYLEREMEKVRREAAAAHAAGTVDDDDEVERPPRQNAAPPPRAEASRSQPDEASGLAEEVRRLRAEVASVKQAFESARTEMDIVTEQLRRELNDLNRQLGI